MARINHQRARALRQKGRDNRVPGTRGPSKEQLKEAWAKHWRKPK